MEITFDKANKKVVLTTWRLDELKEFQFEESTAFLNVPRPINRAYKLGDLLLDFIYLDFEKLNGIKAKYFDINVPTTYEESKNSVTLAWDGFNELTKMHPYFEDFHLELYRWLSVYESVFDEEYFNHLDENTIWEKEGFPVVSISEDEIVKSGVNKYIKRVRTLGKRKIYHLNRYDKESYLQLPECIAKLYKVSSDGTYNSGSPLWKLIEACIEFCFIDKTYIEFNSLLPLEKFYIFDRFCSQLFSEIKYESIFSSYSNSGDNNFNSLIITIPEKRLEESNTARKLSNGIKFRFSVDIDKALVLELLHILSEGVNVKKCLHCGKFFIPESREDEKYCDRNQPNGRTCKQMGWEQKVKSRHYEEYRKTYIKFVAFKLRNTEKFNSKGYNITLDEIFDSWSKFAGYKISYFDSKNYTYEGSEKELDDFISWLDESYKEIKRIVQGKVTSEDLNFLHSTDKKGVKKWLENL